MPGLLEGIIFVMVSIRNRNFKVAFLKMFFSKGATIPSISIGELPLNTPNRLFIDLNSKFMTSISA